MARVQIENCQTSLYPAVYVYGCIIHHLHLCGVDEASHPLECVKPCLLTLRVNRAQLSNTVLLVSTSVIYLVVGFR